MHQNQRFLISCAESSSAINLPQQQAQSHRSAYRRQQVVTQLVTSMPQSIPIAYPSVHKNRRRRGLVLTEQGFSKLLTAKAQLEFAENSGERFTFEELSFRTQLDPRTVSRILQRTEAVDKSSLMQLFRVFNLQLENSDYKAPAPSTVQTACAKTHPHPDLVANTLETSTHTAKLAQLKQQIVADCYQLIVLLGLEGVG
jgi:hypothetical protein